MRNTAKPSPSKQVLLCAFVFLAGAALGVAVMALIGATKGWFKKDENETKMSNSDDSMSNILGEYITAAPRTASPYSTSEAGSSLPQEAAETTSTATSSTSSAASPNSVPPSSSIVECLERSGVDRIIERNAKTFFKAASHCSYHQPEDPLVQASVVAKPATAEAAAAAVRCAKQFDLTVSPRSGSHGFDGDACRGDLILDVTLLDTVRVNDDVVLWGSGLTHGVLYGQLLDYNLVLPGGAEAMVGT